MRQFSLTWKSESYKSVSFPRIAKRTYLQSRKPLIFSDVDTRIEEIIINA